MAEPVWMASTAPAAPYTSHLLREPPVHRGLARVACCGEARVNWQPVEEFAVPSAFAKCQRCLEYVPRMLLVQRGTAGREGSG